ncbi:MAG: winged helix-turn-helix transcriptional regulator [Lachnospiraceae bacterium]|jgi:DNA-binding HxlR family transcriptional regulator
MAKEMICETVGGEGCGLRKVLDLIGGKWKILILCAMKDRGTMRYGQIRKTIVGITNTMLAQSLREMEEDGLVLRRQYDEMPVRVEYSLTDKAKSLLPILMELKAWGEKNIQQERDCEQTG